MSDNPRMPKVRSTRMIFWIASYPKSGNTWVRILLEALTRLDAAPVSINAIARVRSHASNRVLFDQLVGVKASDLPPDLVERLRPEVYALASQAAAAAEYWKIHDAWRLVAPDVSLIPAHVTRGVLYVVRNPLDVAVSLHEHLSLTQDAAIDFMADPEAMLSGSVRALGYQLPQYLKTWSEHVASWLTTSPLPVHLLRYEDLKSAPLATLRAAADFLGLPTEAAALLAALDAAAFDKLRAQEASEGFSERSRHAPVFFRRGLAGVWREELTLQQVQRVIADHGAMMQSLGYLDSSGGLPC